MNNAGIFFNVCLEDSYSGLSDLGNSFLTPVRYLFKGRSVKIIINDNLEPTMHHVRSYHKTPGHQSKSYPLHSLPKNFFKTVLAIVTLIPGLLLGTIFKGLSYLQKSTREEHLALKSHFTPQNVVIGTVDDALNLQQIENALRQIPLNKKIDALVITGNQVEINTDPGISRLNPKKLILIGAKIVHKPGINRLDEALLRKGSWLWKDGRAFQKMQKVEENTFVTQIHVHTLEEALNHPLPRKPKSLSRYHAVYVVNP